jgi:hypothetical protein
VVCTAITPTPNAPNATSPSITAHANAHFCWNGVAGR